MPWPDLSSISNILDLINKSIRLCIAGFCISLALVLFPTILPPGCWTPWVVGLGVLGIIGFASFVIVAAWLGVWSKRKAIATFIRRWKRLSEYERMTMIELREYPTEFLSAKEIAEANKVDEIEIVQSFVTLSNRGLTRPQHDMKHTALTPQGVIVANALPRSKGNVRKKNARNDRF